MNKKIKKLPLKLIKKNRKKFNLLIKKSKDIKLKYKKQKIKLKI